MSSCALFSLLQDSKIKEKLRDYQITKLRLFGSYAKQQSHSGSDVDLLYKLDRTLPRKDWGVFSAKSFLEDVTGKSCDLVNVDCVDDLIRDEILSSKKPLW